MGVEVGKLAPELTIVTICYNEIERIKKTCESIVNQTYINIEWIIVDGGSTDGSLAVIENYRPKISKLIVGKDKGLYDAMNIGLGASKGRYVLFLNGGDQLYSLDTIQRVFEIENNEDILYGDVVYNAKDLHKMPDSMSKEFFYRTTLPHSSTFFSNRFIRQHQLAYDLKYQIASDFDLMLQFLFKNAKFKYIGEPISVFYKDGTSIKNWEKTMEETRTIRAKYYNRLHYYWYEKGWKTKIEHAKMMLTHPRYILGKIKRILMGYDKF